MTLEVASKVIDSVLREADAAFPNECCGILLGETGSVLAIEPADNVHSDPQSHFEIDPQALIDAHRHARAGGPQVLGYYHSHPNGLAEPSATDKVMAARDGAIWAIAAAGRVSFWRAGDAGFEALPYETCAR